jgi:hypothetical protein
MRVHALYRPLLPACYSQNALGVLKHRNYWNGTRASTMLRSAALRCTAEGRLLGFDTGDWSMLLGGFFLAGMLALMV